MNTFAETIKFSDNGNPDYCYALLHLAYFKNNDKYYLIWGMGELIPGELKEDSFWKLAEGFNCFKNQNAEYYFLRKVINKQEVIDIYNSIKNNKSIIVSIENILETINFQYFNDSNQILNIYEEPFPENLFLTVKDNSEFYMPFVANHWGAVRVKGFINNDISFIKQYIDDSKVLDEFKTYLQWNLNEYAELLGSFWFVLPNPLFREVSIRMLPPEKNRQDYVHISLQLRTNKRLDSLTLKCFERRDFGYISFDEVKFDRLGIAIIPISCNCKAISLNICCANRGLIYYEPFEYFIKSFQLTINVNDTEEKNTNETNISHFDENSKYIDIAISNSELKNISFGEKTNFYYNKKFQKTNNFNNVQKIIDKNSRLVGKKFILNLISNAKRQVIFVDYNFTLSKFYEYIIEKFSNKINIIILTNKKQFEENNYGKKANMNNKSGLFNYYRTEQKIKQITIDNYSPKKIKLYTKGDNSLHDCFMIIDNVVYFLSSSLNNIGKKMSLILKLPYPDEVIKEINYYLNNSNSDVDEIR